MTTTTKPHEAREQDTRRDRPRADQPIEAQDARQATRGNGVWIILTISTGLAIAVLLVLFGGATS